MNKAISLRLVVFTITLTVFIGSGVSLFSLPGLSIFPFRIFIPIFLLYPYFNYEIFEKFLNLKPVKPLLFFLAWSFISVFWSFSSLLGLTHFIYFLTGSVLVLICSLLHIKYPSFLEIFLQSIIAFAFLFSCFGILEAFFAVQFFTTPISESELEQFSLAFGFVPPFGTHENWNNFAFDNALLLPFLISSIYLKIPRCFKFLSIIILKLK